jgi:CheY-like chemotaxis protein
MEPKTILVIEDNQLNMKLVKTLLQIQKHQVLEAESAENGLEIAKEQLPDLILMDIQLPGMDGLEATRIIKEDPELMNIPVVALTSFAMQGDEEKAISAGCAGYITKPIDTREFINTLDQYYPNNN